jgi:hypothetical protein
MPIEQVEAELVDAGIDLDDLERRTKDTIATLSIKIKRMKPVVDDVNGPGPHSYETWMQSSFQDKDNRYFRFTALPASFDTGERMIYVDHWFVTIESFMPFVVDYKPHGCVGPFKSKLTCLAFLIEPWNKELQP